MNKKGLLSKEIDDEKVKSVALYLLAFFIPFVLQIGIFMSLKMYPFGDDVYAPVDTISQYIPFLQFFRNIFTNGGSIFYSLSRCLGGETYGLFAYYLASPFNFITLLFEKNNIPFAYEIILISKISVCSVSFTYFLNRKKKANFTNLIFSLMYAFSTYVITYGFNIMWLDGVILLPFVISGIDDLIEEKKINLYVISLVLTIVTNYYIGFMVCIFSVIYFVYKIIITDTNSKREVASKFGLFILSSFFAALISSFVILPVFMGLKNGRADFSFSDLSFEKNFDLINIFSSFKTNSFSINDIQNSAMPPLFCGIFANIFVIIYFMNTKTKWKEKIASLAILIFFLFSFWINGLNLLWMMGNIPAWYIYRYAFCFVFFFVMLAKKGFEGLNNGLLDRIKKDKLKQILSYTITICIFIVSTINILINTNYCMKVLKDEAGNLKQSNYAHLNDSYDRTIKNLKEYDKGLYRIEKQFQVSGNDPLVLNYNGISYSSSTYSKSLYNFLEKVGIKKSHVQVFYNGECTKTADMLLGIKYNISHDYFKDLKNYEEEYREKFVTNSAIIYKNPYYIGMGYGVNEEAINLNLEESNIFETQNSILKSITGIDENVYNKHQGIISKNTNGIKEKDNIYIKMEDNANITYEIEAESNDNMYIHLLAKSNKNASVYVNDREVKKGMNYAYNEIINAGKIQKGEKVIIKIVPENFLIIDGIYVYYENEENLKKHFEKLNEESLELKKISGEKYQGHVNIKEENKYLVLTIPYEDGWKITVDGNNIEYEKIFDALIALKLEKRRT